jgi:hypothetical protein
MDVTGRRDSVEGQDQGAADRKMQLTIAIWANCACKLERRMSSAPDDSHQKPSMEDGYLGPIFDVRAQALFIKQLSSMTSPLEHPRHSFRRKLKHCRLRRLMITCKR